MNPEKLKNIKMIVCDLDGTLLNDKSEISKENLEAVIKLEKTGVLFTLASGRIHSSVKKYADQLKLKTPFISLDGAYVKSTDSDKPLFRSLIPKKKINKLLTISEKLDCEFALTTDEGCYYKSLKKNQKLNIKKIGIELTETDNFEKYKKNTLEVTISSPDKPRVQLVKNKLSFPFSYGFSARLYNSSKNNSFLLEVRRKNVNKGQGVKILCKKLKIKVEECAVICDWYNDLSLFKLGAFNVAMANSIAELKNNADIVTGNSNNQGGVAEFINLLLKTKSGTDG